MSAPLVDVKINLAELIDGYIVEPCEFCIEGWDGNTAWPEMYAMDLDGERWLTDRHWLLPASVCVLGDNMKFTDLPSRNQDAARGWVRGLRENELTPPVGVFGAAFAGVLTLAGLSAFACGLGTNDRQIHALAVNEDQRVGLLMPLRGAGVQGSSLPVTAAALAMHERLVSLPIFEFGHLDTTDAWELAVELTNSGVSA